jgi:hypothetical protein
MEVKIGVQQAARELNIDVDMSADEIQDAVSQALTGGVLAFSDTKGRRVVVPGDKIAYVDVTTSVTGQVGFRS